MSRVLPTPVAREKQTDGKSRSKSEQVGYKARILASSPAGSTFFFNSKTSASFSIISKLSACGLRRLKRFLIAWALVFIAFLLFGFVRFLGFRFGSFNNVEVVIIFAKLASTENHLRNFLDGDIGKMVFAFWGIGFGTNKQAFTSLHFTMNFIQLLGGNKTSSDENKIGLSGFAVLPVKRLVRIKLKALMLTHSGRQHIGIIVFVNHKVAERVLAKQA